MKLYKNWSPHPRDIAGLGCEDQQNWYVAPVIQTRDSGPKERSNFRVVLKDLENQSRLTADEPDHEVYRFNHWGLGWFKIILVRPNTDTAASAQKWEDSFKDYSIADESDLSEEETEEASEIWTHCYSDHSRLKYIKERRAQFEFHSWMDLLQCVRGKFFAGDASEFCRE